jgi:chaperonin cofactor prefoldin
MSEENKQEGQEMPKTNLIPALIESKIGLDLMKAEGNYQQTLKQVLEFEVTEENFEDAQALNKKVLRWLSFVEDHRSDEKKPYLEAGRIVDAAHKKFSLPFEEARNHLQANINTVGKKIEAAAKKAKEEQERIELIKNGINAFILDSSAKIAAATTTEQLLSIERLINLEKGNKSRYQDHLPLLIERSNELTTKIKEQKDVVKELERVAKEMKDALDQGNDEKAQELQQKTEVLEAKMEENTILVQETASKSVILTEIVAPEIDMPATRRNAWKFEVVDMKEVMKKRPELVDATLNHKATNEVLKTLKDTGVLNGKSEYILNGIRFFQDVNY